MLHVVTSAAWLAADFTAAGVAVAHHHGLETFPFDSTDGIWCSGGFAARMRASGLDTSGFTGPADTLLTQLPASVAGRRVAVGTPAQLREHFAKGPVFVKLAGVKDSSRPARVYTGLEQALEALTPPDRPVEHLGPLLASEPLQLAEEYRVLVVDGDCVDAAIYLDADGVTAHDAAETGLRAEALDFARTVLASVPAAAVPSAWMLDVGRTTGGWVPVEANPVWSSNPYGLDLAAVAAAICASGRTRHDMSLPWRMPAYWADRARPLPAGAATAPGSAPHTWAP